MWDFLKKYKNIKYLYVFESNKIIKLCSFNFILKIGINVIIII